MTILESEAGRELYLPISTIVLTDVISRDIAWDKPFNIRIQTKLDLELY